MKNWIDAGVAISALYLMFAAPARAFDAAKFDAANPGASGLTLKFDGKFSSDTIDMNGSGAEGYKWYVTKWYGYPTTTPSQLAIDGDGVLTIDPTDSTNYQIATAAPAKNARGYVGQTFGKGFYIEARLAFNPAQVNTAKGWPAFWSTPIEEFTGKAQWIGQVEGYNHHIENDFFEYYGASWSNPHGFGAALHDWYGVRDVTCPAYCQVTNANGVVRLGPTDWTQFHTIGQLWIPGSAENNNRGSVRTYFDGLPTSTVVTWVNQGDGSPPPSGDFTFSILDKQNLVIILGTGIGAPMKVQYVHVWELPAN